MSRTRPLTHSKLFAALAACTIAAASSAASGQSPAAEGSGPRASIHGIVVNAAAGVPIAGASVDVLGRSGSAIVSHVETRGDGSFRVAALALAGYRVRIRAIGFVPQLLPVAVDAESSSVDMGTIALKASTVELQAVTVTAHKRDVDLAPDRNTYVVRDMPTTRGGSALDVLRNVPAVDVDIDNVVSLRGNSGVIVQINGRPSPMKPAQLGNFLAQLPADMVDRIEVIPNPSARDDPEGVAGIINIVLKQRADAGISGGLTTSGGTTGRAEAGGNLGYQGGPWSLYGSYGFLRDNRPRTDAVDRQNLYTDPLTYLEESGRRTQIPLAHTFTGSGAYQLGLHDELSADLMYSTRTEAETNTIDYYLLDASHTLTGRNDRFSEGTNHEYNFESTLGYKHSFAGAGHKLTAELRAFRAREGGPYRFTSRDLSLDGQPAATTARETQNGYEHPGESSIRMDYARPLSSLVRLEAGYKGSLQRFHTTLDTRVFDDSSAVFIVDTSRTSNFTYDELVNAGYGMLDAQLGSFALQGGLRVEHATTQFHLDSRNATYDNGYNSIFPSALVAWNIDEAHQLKLSYSTRIRRPDDTDLIDPTLHYQDPLNVSRGNPYLQPEYTRSLELGLQRTAEHLTMQLTPFYRHTLNAVRTLRTIDSAGVATRTFANIATTDAYGTDANVAMSGGRVTGFAGASVFRQVSNAANLDPGLSARTFGWSARTNASIHLTESADVQTLLFYQAPMTVEQGRNAARVRFTIAARQKLLGDQLNVTIRVNDPFSTSRDRSTTIDPSFYQISDRRRRDRGVILSVSWNWGRPPKVHEGEGDQGDSTP